MCRLLAEIGTINNLPKNSEDITGGGGDRIKRYLLSILPQKREHKPGARMTILQNYKVSQDTV